MTEPSRTPGGWRRGLSLRRALLTGIAASLTATALLAVGILLVGHFGETEGRILATTFLLAAYGLLALPGGLLLDRSRLRGLASAVLVLTGSGFAVAMTTVWWPDPPEELGKSVWTVSALAAAAAQAAALALRRRDRDPASVRRLYLVSSVLAVVVATLVSIAVWAELESALYFRVLGSLAVLDLLAVALQPVLALARPTSAVYRLRVLVEPDRELETTMSAPDFATAVARAIRSVDRDGGRVLRVERATLGSSPQARSARRPM